MTAIARGYSFTDEETLTGPNVESEFNVIHDAWNNHNKGISRWSVVDVTTLKIAGVAVSIPTITDWASYVPTLGAGVGTPSLVDFWWRQDGFEIQVQGGFRCGTVAASNVSITLPNSTIISSAKQNTNIEVPLGIAVNQKNAASSAIVIGDWGVVFYDLSDTSKVWIGNSAGGGAFTKTNGTVLYANSDWVGVKFSYPIA